MRNLQAVNSSVDSWSAGTWLLLQYNSCYLLWELSAGQWTTMPATLQELSAWHLLTPCPCFLGSLARIWRQWEVLLRHWECKLDETSCYSWIVSKALCAPAAKVSSVLLEYPVSQPFPGLILSMQILICFLPILAVSTCQVQNKLSVWTVKLYKS